MEHYRGISRTILRAEVVCSDCGTHQYCELGEDGTPLFACEECEAIDRMAALEEQQ